MTDAKQVAQGLNGEYGEETRVLMQRGGKLTERDVNQAVDVIKKHVGDVAYQAGKEQAPITFLRGPAGRRARAAAEETVDQVVNDIWREGERFTNQALQLRDATLA